MANLNARGKLGNRSRTGRKGRPPNSGRPRLLGKGAITSLTIRISTEERNKWGNTAKLMGYPSLGSFIRDSVAIRYETDYIF